MGELFGECLLGRSGVLGGFFGECFFILLALAECISELEDSLTEGFAELWEATRAEQYDDDDGDKQQLRA